MSFTAYSQTLADILAWPERVSPAPMVIDLAGDEVARFLAGEAVRMSLSLAGDRRWMFMGAVLELLRLQVAVSSAWKGVASLAPLWSTPPSGAFNS